MSLPAFQTALARLIVDSDFRRAVRQQGAAALASELTGRERQRLLTVASDPGLEITRTLHKGFRLGKLLAQLPLTCTLLGEEILAREIDAFWQQRLPVSFYYLEEAIAFCDHLLGRARAELDLPYIEEIVAYERAGLELQRARPGGETPEPPEGPVPTRSHAPDRRGEPR